MAEVVEVSGCHDAWLGSYEHATRVGHRSFSLGWFHWLQDQCHVKRRPVVDARAEKALSWIQGELPRPNWEGLVGLQKHSTGDSQYAILETVEYYVNHVLVGTYGYKLNVLSTIRAFYAWNRAPLPEDPQFKIHADRIGMPGKLTVDVFRDVVKAARIRDRSLLMVKWMTFLDWEGLDYLNHHCADELVQQMRAGVKILGPFWLPGRKQLKMKQEGRFYVLIGHDAIMALQEYFEKERGWPKPGEPIWLTMIRGRHALGKRVMLQNWTGIIRRLGLAKKRQLGNRSYRTGFAGHETRDAASSLIHRAKLQGFDLDVAEFMKGHVSKIDPNKYDKFYLDVDWVMEQYRIIEPYLNIITGKLDTAQSNLEDKKRIDAQQQQIEQLQFAVRMLQDVSGYRVK